MPAKAKQTYNGLNPNGDNDPNRSQDFYDWYRGYERREARERAARYKPPPIEPDRYKYVPDLRDYGDRTKHPPASAPVQTVPWTDEDQRIKDRNFVPRLKRQPKRPALKRPFDLPGIRSPVRLPINNIIDLIDMADELARDPISPRPGPGTPTGGRLMCQAAPITDPLNGYNNVDYVGFRSGNVNAGDCGLGLQAWSGATQIAGNIANNTVWPATPFTLITLNCKVNGPAPCGQSGARYRYAQVWWWPAGPSQTTNGLTWVPSYVPIRNEPDPNQLRLIGALPAPPDAGKAPDPLLSGFPDNGLDSPTVINTGAWAFAETSTGTSGAAAVVGRVPTTSGVRERKFMSRSARIGAALFKILDAGSEWAEVVSAIYDALPDDVRKRWDRPDRRFTDQAGQYGLDGADWKAQAIFWNLHKLDMEQAVLNIIENHLEDKLYGAIHKRLPKQTGAALDQGMMQLAELLAELKGLVYG